MVGRLGDAGWLVAQGETRGRTYRPSELVEGLDLESPGLARRMAGAVTADE